MLDKKEDFCAVKLVMREQNGYEFSSGDIKGKYLPVYRMDLFGSRGTLPNNLSSNLLPFTNF